MCKIITFFQKSIFVKGIVDSLEDESGRIVEEASRINKPYFPR